MSKTNYSSQSNVRAYTKDVLVPEVKTCRVCGTTLPLTDFSRDRDKKDNRQRLCKTCDKQKSKDFYRNNPEYFKKYKEENHKQIRAKHRECLFLMRAKGGYLRGTGICIFCGEINPFKLELHHPFGREHSLEIHECANCHRLQHRFSPMVEVTL